MDLTRILLNSLLALAGLVCALLVLGYVFITHRIKGQYYVSNGVRIHYTIEGEGEPVILLHGLAVHSDLNWRRTGIIKALAGEFRVIALDLRGHGLSGKPHDPNLYGMEMVNDVFRLMEHLKIEKAHVAGYSLGAFIVLRLVATDPRRFFSASCLGYGWEPFDGRLYRESLPQLEKGLLSRTGIEPLSGRLGGDRKRPGPIHTLCVRLMTGFFNNPHALMGTIRTLPELALMKSELCGLPIPICTIIGSDDPFKVGADAMAGFVADHTLVIVDGADHISMSM